MNRKQRRAAVKNKVTAKELQGIVSSEQYNARSTAVSFYSVAIAYVLYTKLHFGKKKIIMTMKQIQTLFDDVNSGAISFEKMKKILYDEVDLEFTER